MASDVAPALMDLAQHLAINGVRDFRLGLTANRYANLLLALNNPRRYEPARPGGVRDPRRVTVSTEFGDVLFRVELEH